MDSRQMSIIGIIAVIVIIAGIYASGIISSSATSENENTITVLAGAGTVKAVNKLTEEFEKQNPGVKINVQYGGSGELFAILDTQKIGDVFIPGDFKFMEDSQNKGYIINDTVKPIVKHIPVIAVQKGNPKNIETVHDLANSEIKVALGNSNATAIGKQSDKILNKTNLTSKVKKNVVIYAPTVNQLLTYLTTGQVDAAIITEDIALKGEGSDKIEIIEIPKDQNAIATIPVGIITFTKNRDLATKFENFIVSKEGLEIWQNAGFKPVS